MDASPITPDLFIGVTPRLDEYESLRQAGVRMIINMREEQAIPPDEHPFPLEILWLRTHDNPFLPIPIPALAEGVQRALPVIAAGGKVFVHCAYGRHRSVAMGAAILIAQGYEAQAAMQLIKEKRRVADPGMFYIKWRIERFQQYWLEHRKEIHS